MLGTMSPTLTPISFTDAELDAVAYDANGFVAAIVQEVGTGRVLMFACETSGDRQYVREAYYDCDMDALLFVVEQEGRGACHTGERSCFFRAFGSGATPGPV